MNLIKGIKKRRSIRNFKDKPIEPRVIREILQAGTYAPSPKNRQPWRFVVITEKEKKNMLEVIAKGLEKEGLGEGMMNQYAGSLPGAYNTLKVMEQAPVTVFIFNTSCQRGFPETGPGEYLFQLSNVQAIGACIQNMLLAAVENKVGSLWICDIFFAYDEICDWLGGEDQLMAAVSFGYTEKSPRFRNLKTVDEVTQWR